MKDDGVYIKNILDAIGKIERFTKDVSENEFLNDQMLQSATILQLALIGEEANKISDAVKSKIPLAWKEIVAFRNIAFHDYMNLKLDIVWSTVADDIPILKEELLKAK